MKQQLADHNDILTFSGVYFSPLKPRQEDVRIEDIAHHLANTCRFSGAVRSFYSVAQHSWFVSRLCDPEWAMEGLLHDATEAYINDIATPLKRAPEFRAYKESEEHLANTIADALNIRRGGSRAHPSIKEADVRMLFTEKRDLMPITDYLWTPQGVEPYPALHIVPWSPEQAERQFLHRFHQLNSTSYANSSASSLTIDK